MCSNVVMPPVCHHSAIRHPLSALHILPYTYMKGNAPSASLLTSDLLPQPTVPSLTLASSASFSLSLLLLFPSHSLILPLSSPLRILLLFLLDCFPVCENGVCDASQRVCECNPGWCGVACDEGVLHTSQSTKVSTVLWRRCVCSASVAVPCK